MTTFCAFRRQRLICIISIALLLSLGFFRSALAFQTFADEDRSAELTGEVSHQQYQFNTPTTVTYDKDSLATGASNARVYVADMGNHLIRVLNLNGVLTGLLDAQDQSLAADSPATTVPSIKAPLGIAFLSLSEADDDRLAGLYVNDVGQHQIHFFRTVSSNAGDFEYVTSIGQQGHGGGDELTLPRNITITPEGYLYVSDEFNHRLKVFSIDPDNAYQVTLVQTLGYQDSQGNYVGAGPIIKGIDKNYGVDSTWYDDYAGEADKLDGFRIPQGISFYQEPTTGKTYIYSADNGNNRIKIFRIDPITGMLSLFDMLGRFKDSSGNIDHLKRPRGVRIDADGNLYVADTYNGRILRFDNLANATDPDPIRYRTSLSSDAQSTFEYGALGIHQVLMRTPATALTEDQALQLPNDFVPIVDGNGNFYRENIWAWGYYYANARVHLVSDSGNNRIKKCWTNASGQTLLRCSVSAGVAGVANHEFWGYPRTLTGQLHSASGMTWLNNTGRLLVSDTPNTRINIYDANGQYQGRFTNSDIGYGVTGINRFTDPVQGELVAVLVASDASLPWFYTGDSALRIYNGSGQLQHIFNLTYRTDWLSVPEIALTNGNYPVSVDIKPQGGRNHRVYITSFGNQVWSFDYNNQYGTLTYDWYAGGSDSQKGTDLGDSWLLGNRFFNEGDTGTFDQIGGVLALDNRLYVVDRRNQRIQALNPDTGAYIGKLGLGGGTYDHPTSLNPNQLFLPVGLHYDASQAAFLLADGFNMLARSWNNPDLYNPDAQGVITPTYQGHWYDTALGTQAGGLFDAEQITSGGGYIFVFSLISNRITSFSWSEIQP